MNEKRRMGLARRRRDRARDCVQAEVEKGGEAGGFLAACHLPAAAMQHVNTSVAKETRVVVVVGGAACPPERLALAVTASLLFSFSPLTFSMDFATRTDSAARRLGLVMEPLRRGPHGGRGSSGDGLRRRQSFAEAIMLN